MAQEGLPKRMKLYVDKDIQESTITQFADLLKCFGLGTLILCFSRATYSLSFSVKIQYGDTNDAEEDLAAEHSVTKLDFFHDASHPHLLKLLKTTNHRITCLDKEGFQNQQLVSINGGALRNALLFCGKHLQRLCLYRILLNVNCGLGQIAEALDPCTALQAFELHDTLDNSSSLELSNSLARILEHHRELKQMHAFIECDGNGDPPRDWPPSSTSNIFESLFSHPSITMATLPDLDHPRTIQHIFENTAKTIRTILQQFQSGHSSLEEVCFGQTIKVRQQKGSLQLEIRLWETQSNQGHWPAGSLMDQQPFATALKESPNLAELLWEGEDLNDQGFCTLLSAIKEKAGFRSLDLHGCTELSHRCLSDIDLRDFKLLKSFCLPNWPASNDVSSEDVRNNLLRAFGPNLSICAGPPEVQQILTRNKWLDSIQTNKIPVKLWISALETMQSNLVRTPALYAFVGQLVRQGVFGPPADARITA